MRESENVPLLRQSGADRVVTSSEAAGRLLGMSTSQPSVSQVIEDLLDQGSGLDLVSREVRPDEVGGPLAAVRGPRDRPRRPYHPVRPPRVHDAGTVGPPDRGPLLAAPPRHRQDEDSAPSEQ